MQEVWEPACMKRISREQKHSRKAHASEEKAARWKYKKKCEKKSKEKHKKKYKKEIWKRNIKKKYKKRDRYESGK